MNRLRSILLCAAAVGWLAWPPAASDASAAGEVVARTDAQPEAQLQQDAADQQQARARVDHLAELEAQQRAWNQLEARRQRELLDIQIARSADWAELLRTNWPAYEALHQQAANSPRHTAPCTICNGRGSLAFCILCGNSGKCVRCNGTGELLGERCPMCRGRGKCFLCFGTGKMTCPFCDDGDVYFHAAPPPRAMPVPANPIPQPALQPSGQPNSTTEQGSLAARDSTSASSAQNGPSGQAASEAAPPEDRTGTIGLAAAVILGGVLLFRRVAPKVAEGLNARFDPWAPMAAAAAGSAQLRVTEEKSFSDFLTEFRIGPMTFPGLALRPGRHGDLDPAAASALESARDPLESFLALAPKQVQGFRKLLQEIGREAGEPARQEMLGHLGGEIRLFKGMAGIPEVLPAWQMACALEWLVKQLAEKTGRVTASTLRTVGNGVDLLSELCRTGLRADLCTNPPIRTLAVDDDAIGRRAVAFSLKKGVGQPDLAEDGPSALALAAKQTYDVIFLDVQMPGMDGFEACSRIHETKLNRQTPVVFVTMHSDFEARARSTLCGGNDLIGKPFLTFEITVKALTLALRSRLSAESSTAGAPERIAQTSGTEAPAPALAPVLRSSVADGGAVAGGATAEGGPVLRSSVADGGAAAGGATAEGGPVLRSSVAEGGAAAGGATAEGGPPAPPASDTNAPDKSYVTPANEKPKQAEPQKGAAARAEENDTEGFYIRAMAQVEALRELAQRASKAAEGEADQGLLADMYCRLSSLLPASGHARVGAAGQVLAALEALLKKVLEHPRNLTPSTFQTLAASLDLLGSLCVPGLRPDLATNPPIRLLVVDDDPLARRAISGGLQVAFGRPDSAENGQAAVDLAQEKAYDTIFMDVQMPGMDGLAACAKIRETASNRDTPVVFVTMHSDEETRRAAVKSGGSDLLTKPFLCSELTLKALTLTLRGRLQKSDA